ncbi:hypothetical protein HK102_008017, partial [Quaeritorhiza haematococci]
MARVAALEVEEVSTVPEVEAEVEVKEVGPLKKRRKVQQRVEEMEEKREVINEKVNVETTLTTTVTTASHQKLPILHPSPPLALRKLDTPPVSITHSHLPLHPQLPILRPVPASSLQPHLAPHPTALSTHNQKTPQNLPTIATLPLSSLPALTHPQPTTLPTTLPLHGNGSGRGTPPTAILPLNLFEQGPPLPIVMPTVDASLILGRHARPVLPTIRRQVVVETAVIPTRPTQRPQPWVMVVENDEVSMMERAKVLVGGAGSGSVPMPIETPIRVFSNAGVGSDDAPVKGGATTLFVAPYASTPAFAPISVTTMQTVDPPIRVYSNPVPSSTTTNTPRKDGTATVVVSASAPSALSASSGSGEVAPQIRVFGDNTSSAARVVDPAPMMKSGIVRISAPPTARTRGETPLGANVDRWGSRVVPRRAGVSAGMGIVVKSQPIAARVGGMKEAIRSAPAAQPTTKTVYVSAAKSGSRGEKTLKRRNSIADTASSPSAPAKVPLYIPTFPGVNVGTSGVGGMSMSMSMGVGILSPQSMMLNLSAHGVVDRQLWTAMNQQHATSLNVDSMAAGQQQFHFGGVGMQSLAFRRFDNTKNNTTITSAAVPTPVIPGVGYGMVGSTPTTTTTTTASVRPLRSRWSTILNGAELQSEVDSFLGLSNRAQTSEDARNSKVWKEVHSKNGLSAGESNVFSIPLVMPKVIPPTMKPKHTPHSVVGTPTRPVRRVGKSKRGRAASLSAPSTSTSTPSSSKPVSHKEKNVTPQKTATVTATIADLLSMPTTISTESSPASTPSLVTLYLQQLQKKNSSTAAAERRVQHPT